MRYELETALLELIDLPEKRKYFGRNALYKARKYTWINLAEQII